MSRKHIYSNLVLLTETFADMFPKAKKAKTEYEWDADWREKYGEKAAKVIRDTVDQNMEDYLYMKQFAIKI